MNRGGGIDMNIFISVEIPDGDFCRGCKFITPIINLYSEPKCIVFQKKLDYVHRDNWEKCDECRQIIKDENDELNENER